MTSPAVTYSFTNGTTADASQINQNFTDLIAAMTDGSKSFSIDALTVAGAATFNGTVALGNATGDDITGSGYFARSIIPKTDDTYDLGAAALAWKNAYFDGSIYTDTIAELTDTAGVTIDGLLVKDGGISNSSALAIASTAAGVNVTTHNSAGDDFTVNTTALVVEGDTGRVGIGIAAPTSQVHQYMASGEMSHKIDAAALGNGEGAYFLSNSKKSGGTERYAFFGTTYNSSSTSNETCGVIGLPAGDGNTSYLWTDNSDVLRISVTNTHIGTASGTAVGDQTSDERLKSNISPIDYGLSTVLQLSPIQFDMNEKHQVGFSAQSIKKLIPEAVYDTNEAIDDSGNGKLAMQYYQIIPVLVKAIQELSDKVDKYIQH